MDEQPCTLPLEYSNTLRYGAHVVDMKFTDDCAQVKMESVRFDLKRVPQMDDPGILYKYY